MNTWAKGKRSIGIEVKLGRGRVKIRDNRVGEYREGREREGRKDKRGMGEDAEGN